MYFTSLTSLLLKFIKNHQLERNLNFKSRLNQRLRIFRQQYYHLNKENDGIDIATGTQSSCALTYHGRMLVFGGVKRIGHQIAEIDKCQLKRVGSLPFQFANGGCAVSQNQIFLCFPSEDVGQHKKGLLKFTHRIYLFQNEHALQQTMTYSLLNWTLILCMVIRIFISVDLKVPILT